MHREKKEDFEDAGNGQCKARKPGQEAGSSAGEVEPSGVQPEDVEAVDDGQVQKNWLAG